MRQPHVIALALCLAACEGAIEVPLRQVETPVEKMKPAGPNIVDFSCDPNAAWTSVPLRRLSQAQYRNAVADALTSWVPAQAAAVLATPSVVSALRQFPPDARVTTGSDKHGGLSRLSQTIVQEHADAHFAVANAVAKELTKTPAKIGQLLGTCATDAMTSNDVACVQSFIQKAGLKTHRRALAQDDANFYWTVYAATGISAEGLADVLTVMLSNPYFVFEVEHGVEAPVFGTKDVYEVDLYELASRLSFQFGNTAPDEALLSMAATGFLATPMGFEEALRRISASPQGQVAYSELFREWMSLEDLPELDLLSGTPRYDAVLGGFHPGPDTREHMIDEAVRVGTWYAGSSTGKFSDLFTTHKSFATTADVAQVYGLPAWDGKGEPPDAPDAERVGLLTHAALVASGTPETHPILKGAFARTALLCDAIGPPPADAMSKAQASDQMLSPLLTTRERTQAVTEIKGTNCAVCHANLINPLGFVTENFDPVGRKRNVQPIFDSLGTGLGFSLLPTTPVLASVVSGDKTPARDAAQVQQLMLASQKPQACFARKYFRFTFGRVEDDALDGCALKTIRDGLVEDRPLGATLLQIARTRAFHQRRFD